jgi:hypothetical protein
MQLKPIAAITVLLVVVFLVSITGCTSSNNEPTATPAAAASTARTATPTVKSTATVKPTTTPTPISAILVERGASPSGPDRTAEINKNMPTMPHHRVTIDGHDAYVYHGSVTSSYVFPCNSWSEAQALHASLAAKFKANGFTVDSTEQPVTTWGENSNSMLTGLNRGNTDGYIGSAETVTVKPYTNIEDTAESEVSVFISE